MKPSSSGNYNNGTFVQPGQRFWSFSRSWSVGCLTHFWASRTFCVGNVLSISQSILNCLPSFLCWVILTQPLTLFCTAFGVLNLRRQLRISLKEGPPFKVCKSGQRTLVLWKGEHQLFRLYHPLTILELIWHLTVDLIVKCYGDLWSIVVILSSHAFDKMRVRRRAQIKVPLGEK